MLLAGGLLPGDRTTGRVVLLDLRSGRATSSPSLLVPVHDAAAGLVHGRPTVVGGGNTAESAALQSLGSGAWRPIGNLPSTRSDVSVVEWHHHAFVIGGYDGTSEPTGVLRVTPQGATRRVGELTHGVRYAATARIGSHVYVLGGEVAGRELDTIQRVDLRTGRTRPAGRLPVPLGHATAVAVAGRILVIGGRVTPARQTDGLWWFDPVTGRVLPAGHCPFPVSDAAVATHGHRIWVLGGETPRITDDVVEMTVR
jgi:hypothetical protein